MAYVPEGEFLMGARKDLYKVRNAEKTEHKVYLDTYWIYQTEVTNAMYTLCVEAGACTLPVKISWDPRIGGFGVQYYANHPVIYINWNQADEYCQWAGGRLPTEAEWEKAARGIDGNIYPWGNQEPNGDLLNFADKNFAQKAYWADTGIDDGYPYTSLVGNNPKGASFYGAMDMAGNVIEWVADQYDKLYYPRSPSQNPQGPEKGSGHVLRGGAFGLESEAARCVARTWFFYWNINFGFRCVVSP